MSSVSGTSSSAYTNRITGLESGLDTEALIEGLTITEQTRIDKANQQKQLLTWKRDAYREIINNLTSFNKKYFSASSTYFQNLLTKHSATVSNSKYVSVNPGSNALKSKIVISDIVSLASASKMESSTKVTKPLALSVDDTNLSSLSGKEFKVSLDGVEKTIKFSDISYDDINAVKAELQSQLNTAFGQGRVSVSEEAGKLVLNSSGNTLILNKTDVAENDVSGIIDFTAGQKNTVSLYDKLSDAAFNTAVGDTIKFYINGTEFNFTGDNTINDVIKTVNSSTAGVTMTYSNLTDSFTLTSKETGAGNQITLQDDTGSFLSAAFGPGKFTDGTNAEIRINTNADVGDANSLTYTTVIKSSNTFEIDGVSYTLLGKAEGEELENIEVKVDYDIDAAVSAVKEFVNDYNSLLKSITDKLSEPKYKDFDPLTDAERKALDDDDVKEYEAKAKSGLLRGDSYLNTIANSLRTAISADVKNLSDNSAGIGTMLADLGITTGHYSEKGQLNLDESKLRKSLEENSDKVVKLFTQNASVPYSQFNDAENAEKRYKESGLLNRISDILQNNIRSTNGVLTKLVGLSNSDYTSIFANKLSNIDDKILVLKERLQKQQDYYWKKFTAMEKALSEMNKKGSWITANLGISE